MADVNTELARPATTALSLNESIVRQTAAQISGTGVLSGQISMDNLRGAKGTKVLGGFTPATVTNPSSGFQYIGYRNGIQGSWSPTPLVELVADGAIIKDFYTYYTFSSPLTLLYIDRPATYTGDLIIYSSTDTNDPWPNTFFEQFSYSTFYNAWGFSGAGTVFIGDVRSWRIQKAT